SFHAGSTVPPAATTAVGRRSRFWIGKSYVLPAGILPIHWAQNGMRVPPSDVVALNPRSGPLFDVVDAVGPPLSEKKKMSVFSSSPRSRTLASTFPTAS